MHDRAEVEPLNTSSAITLESVCTALAEIAPLGLAEPWDNVGLLVGQRQRLVKRVMTCLTISPVIVDESIEKNVDLIIAHHPLPFKALQKITSDSVAGSMLLKLIQGETAVYSAHTAFDSAAAGINQMWADALSLTSIEPLVDASDLPTDDSVVGAGRVGRLPESISLDQLVRQAAGVVGAATPRRVGAADRPVSKIALACGSGGSFLSAARRRGCEAMITGEATFHTCLEAESLDIGLGLLGHYCSERFAMERLADQLSIFFPNLTVWPSTSEHDPIVTVIA